MTDSNALKGKHVFVIGGGSGMGLGIARLALKNGAHVSIGSNDKQQLAQIAPDLPSVRMIDIDISKRTSVESAFSGLPAIDHLVLTAGRRINGKVSECDPDYLFEAVQERVAGAIYMVKAALPLLSPGSSITFTSGVLAQRPLSPGNAVFAASVGAIDALVRGLALELAPIRVNAVAPGVTDTGLFAKVESSEREAFLQKSAARTLVGRVGSVDDIAQAFVFVMTSGFMSGAILQIDGGMRIS